MAQYELRMPRMGESVTEATITRWLKKAGEKVEADEPVLEVATDKVDSEIPSPVEGVLREQKFAEGDTVPIDSVIALIETLKEEETAGSSGEPPAESSGDQAPADEPPARAMDENPQMQAASRQQEPGKIKSYDESGRFFSPLVRSIAREENISMEELSAISGSGQNNRITKNDLIEFLQTRQERPPASSTSKAQARVQDVKTPEVKPAAGDQIIQMSRMRKLIAEHMLMSEATSVHITLFAEADMTNIVEWRNQHKDQFQKRENQKLTFTPVFIEAIARALRDFPMVNVSVAGDNIIVRRHINIGMAAATPEGNLIVPVIHNADQMNLLGLARRVNDLATRARNNQLKPDEIQGGTFTLTNFGIFGLLSGTPIINQPQVAILGVGAIVKKPVVIESSQGDSIGIRQRMTLSLACDHRVVDGALGGQFLQRLVYYLENFDSSRNP